MPPEDIQIQKLKELADAAEEIEKKIQGTTESLKDQFVSWERIAQLQLENKDTQDLLNQALDAELGKKKDILLEEELKLERLKQQLAVEEAKKRANDELLQDEQRKVDLANQYLDQLSKTNVSGDERARIEANIKRELDVQVENLEKVVKEGKETVTGLKNQGKQIDVNIVKTRRQAEEQDDVADAVRGSANAADDLLAKFFGISQQTQSFIGQLAIGKDGLKRFVSGFFDAGKQFDALAAKAEEFAMNLGRQVMGMVLSVDQAMVDLTRSTGQLDRSFQEEITGIVAAGEAMGITYEEAAGAYGELFASSKGFVTLSKAQQVEAGKQATQFAKLGVSTQAYGSILDTVTKTFRQSVGETKALTTRFVNLSGVLGRLPNDVINEFNDSLSVLARNGPDAVGQFEKLAMVARQAGTDVNTLLGITRQFETFGSASEAVGTLNAMLGGPFLNTMEMVNASFDDPAKTIELLSNAVNRSGQSFASMDAAMKQAIASQAGISDMNIAEKLFGGELTYDELQKQLNDTSVSFEELGKNASKNLSISETLNMILQDTFRQMEENGTDIGEMFKDMATALRKVIEFINEMGASSVLKWGMILMAAAPLFNLLGGIIGLLGGVKMAQIAAGVAGEQAGRRSAAGWGMAGKAMRLAGGFAGLAMLIDAGMTPDEERGKGSVIKGAMGGALLGLSVSGGNPFVGIAGAVVGGLGGYAEGTNSARAGMAVVGERGPELVQMGGGERVYNNREFSEMLNTNNVSSSVERMNAVNSTTQRIVANNMMAQRVSTEKSTEIMEKLADGTNINVTGKAPVVLKLDNRELAKSVVEIIGDNVRPRSAI